MALPEVMSRERFEVIFTSTKLMPMLILILMILPLTRHFYASYAVYLSLGPGGTPATFPGFLRVSLLGLFRVRDPYLPRSITTVSQGYLTTLPTRRGPRPEVRGIAPQRQITQRSSPDLITTMTARIESLATSPESSSRLEIGTSCFEKHGTGLFVSAPAASARSHTSHACKLEVVHIHGSDGSMHLTLHPADAKIVLEARWGERHPLARGGRFERFVPEGFMMIYAGRDEGECETLMRVVRAAEWFVGGGNGTTEAGHGNSERPRRVELGVA